MTEPNFQRKISYGAFVFMLLLLKFQEFMQAKNVAETFIILLFVTKNGSTFIPFFRIPQKAFKLFIKSRQCNLNLFF